MGHSVLPGFVREHKWSLLAVGATAGVLLAYYNEIWTKESKAKSKELDKLTEATMHKLDTDLDGNISPEELAEGSNLTPKEAETVIELLDENQDGSLQREELARAQIAWEQSSGGKSFFAKLFGHTTSPRIEDLHPWN